MRIVIGEGSCGIAAGAQKVRSALEALITEPIGSTGCIGMCYLEPIVDLYEGKELVRRLVRVSDKDAEAIAEAVKTGDLSKVDSITITPDDEDLLRLTPDMHVRVEGDKCESGKVPSKFAKIIYVKLKTKFTCAFSEV